MGRRAKPKQRRSKLAGPQAPASSSVLLAQTQQQANSGALALAASFVPQPVPVSLDRSVALVLLPPPAIARRFEAIRKAHDKAYRHWPAHISIMWPCPADIRSKDVQARLVEHLSALRPFSVSLSFPEEGRVGVGPRQSTGQPALSVDHPALPLALGRLREGPGQCTGATGDPVVRQSVQHGGEWEVAALSSPAMESRRVRTSRNKKEGRSYVTLT